MINKAEIVRRLQSSLEFHVPYSDATKHPFVECTHEVFNDRVYVFLNESGARRFVKKKKQDDYPVRALQVEAKNRLAFFMGLFFIGVNEVLVCDGEMEFPLMLRDIVREPDFMQQPPEKRPITNSSLQLTGLYLMQEMRRPVPEAEKKNVRELDEELAADIVKACFIGLVELSADVKRDGAQLTVKNPKYPCVQNPAGDMFQPVFTDPEEYRKFGPKKDVQTISLPFAELEKFISGQSKGIVINPNTMNLILSKEQLLKVAKRFA